MGPGAAHEHRGTTVGAGRARHAGRAPSAEVRVLALGCAVAGLLASFAAVVPFSDTAPTGLAAVMGAVGLLLGGALGRCRDGAPAGVAHAVVVLATLCVTACVGASTTPAGTAVTAVGFVWVALFSAVFHGRRALAAHLALVLAGLAGGLLTAGATSVLQTWAFLGVTLCLVAGVVNGDVGRLRRRADVDGLTGALTRGAFRARAESAMAAARRRGHDLTLAIVDLDDFKLVNDSGGHAAGDRLLAEVTRDWDGVLGPRDLVGRQGGDEFVLLLHAPADDGARQTLARMRETPTGGRWTAGVAPWSGDGFEEWLARADGDLYRRKDGRRTRRRG